MAMEYKKILLHKGLKMLTDYQFRTVRCLLADELQLTPQMREDSDRIKIADRIFSKFPGAASVDKLIDTLKDDPELKEFVDSLRKEKQNVKRRLKTTGEKARSRQQDGAGPSAPLSSPDGPKPPQGAAEDSVAQKRKHNTEGEKGVKKNKGAQMSSKAPYPVGASPSRTQTATRSFSPDTKNYPTATPIFQLDKPSILPTMPSSVSMASSTSLTESPSAAAKVAEDRKTLSQGPVTVLVLERSQRFNYEFMGQGHAFMFYATVATESQFFWVKVFHDTLWYLFTENAVLTISGHSICRGTLEVSEASVVSPTTALLQVPKSVMKRACEPPKIDDLCKAVSGTPVYGRYKVVKKIENKKNTIYEIKDKTGSIEVVGSGQWYGLPCEPGDQLQLFCLRVRTVKKKTILMCEKHSLIQVVESSSLRHMDTEYKAIFLKNGLEMLSDYQFRAVKCLLASPLRLTPHMQEDYDRIQITTQMFARFRGATCVMQLIEAIKGDRELEGLVKSLKQQLGKGTTYRPPLVSPELIHSPETTFCSLLIIQEVELHPDTVSWSPLINWEHELNPATTSWYPFISREHDLGQSTASGAPIISQENDLCPSTMSWSRLISRKQDLSSGTTSWSLLIHRKHDLCPGTTSWFLLINWDIDLCPGTASGDPIISQKNDLCPSTMSWFRLISRKQDLGSGTTSWSLLIHREDDLCPGTTSWSLLIHRKHDLCTGTASRAPIISQKNDLYPSTMSWSHLINRKQDLGSGTTSWSLLIHRKHDLCPGTTSWFLLINWDIDLCPGTASGAPIISQKNDLCPSTMSWFRLISRKQDLGSGNTSWSVLVNWEIDLYPVVKAKHSTFQTQNMGNKERNPMGLGVLTISSAFLGFFRASPSQPQAPGCPSLLLESESVSLSGLPSQSASRLVGTFQEEGQQDQRKEMQVLDVTEPFRYREDRTMFHAIVAIKNQTQNQIVRVKVFHEGFKTNFLRGNILVLSNYIGHRGFVEVYKCTSVETVGYAEVPEWLINMVTETPKISHLRQEAPNTVVNGVFLVSKSGLPTAICAQPLSKCQPLTHSPSGTCRHTPEEDKLGVGAVAQQGGHWPCIRLTQKVVRHPCVYYEVQDETGTMQVVVYGHLTGIPCERGNRIQLICFERGEEQHQIRSSIQSFLKVI
ncbi:uncharacterized protein LOC130018891 [Sorex fumeus]|uniref:uncharacterized protein LOC130018891 n=1 Tax=Sorex fumeus TaxID=62283 RepID=UPI0024AC8BAA|nr:uncharacterized protein LOC130018891 [Sorex fumeus]